MPTARKSPAAKPAAKAPAKPARKTVAAPPPAPAARSATVGKGPAVKTPAKPRAKAIDKAPAPAAPAVRTPRRSAPVVDTPPPAHVDLLPQRVAVQRTRAERIIAFIETYMPVPEGMLAGQMHTLLPEQKQYLRDVYDNTDAQGRLLTRTGILCAPRKNGKTGVISPLGAAHVIGPEAKLNSQCYSAARSRDQAALLFNYMQKSLRMNPQLEGHVRISDSIKRVLGVEMGATFQAVSADAPTKFGLSPAMTVHDELGQVEGPQDALFDAFETAGGAQAEPLTHIISTQAASDTALLSVLIDSAIANPSPDTVLHLYTTPAGKNVDIFDEEVWRIANFALGHYRSLRELQQQARRVKDMPSFENTFRNLYLNQRVTSVATFIAETVWQRAAAPDAGGDLWYTQPVHAGLDLSRKRDLTACVLAVRDPANGTVHVRHYVFTPRDGLAERARVDKSPYLMWEKQGTLIAVAGGVVDYIAVAEHMVEVTDGMHLASVSFDRWRIDDFKKAAADAGFGTAEHTVWLSVNQSYRDMSPRIDVFEELLTNDALKHDDNPAANRGVQGAVVSQDAHVNRRLEKLKSRSRIDPLVSAVMAVYAAHNGVKGEVELPQRPVSESSLLFV